MRFKLFLEKIRDIEDSGASGKNFEKYFVNAAKLLGLEFEENIANGPGYDIKTKGAEWKRLLSDTEVNIKVYGTKWLFSSTELAKYLPWDELPEDYKKEKYEKRVRKVLNDKGITQIIFLKPKNKNIQKQIMNAVDNKDIDKLNKLFVKQNFMFEKLGRFYDVRILDNGERVTSIAIDKKGKVFMRSEKPRKLGNTMTVTFRAPSVKISKKERGIKSRS
ncbi:MAG: hypothetical protein ACOC2U_02795 [bacterium]